MGFFQPAAQGEITMLKNRVDVYDITVINGVNIPIEFKATNGKPSGAWTCGAAGSPNPTTSVGACDWNLKPPLTEYFHVTAGGNSCSNDWHCGWGKKCGLSFNPGHANLLKKTCGYHIGYWTANQICGVQRNYGAPFYCSNQLSSPNAGLTNWHILACVGMGSCYTNGAPSNCCGCADWHKHGIDAPSNPTTEACKNENPNWNNYVLDKLHWLKSACPTAYTYPYDDASATFTCEAYKNGMNSVNYEVTFCPGSKTGGYRNHAELGSVEE